MIATRRILEGSGDRAETFHVYADRDLGNDSTGTGTKTNPYATTTKALSMVTAGQSIGLKAGGTFRPAAALAPTFKVRIGRYGSGADPIISGGTLVTGWGQQTTGGASWASRFKSFASGVSASSYTITPDSNTTAGNTGVLAIHTGGGVLVSGVTDSVGNTWTVDASSSNTSLTRAHVASSHLTTALTTSDTFTVTLAASGSMSVAAHEYSGFVSSSFVDVSAQANAASGTSAAIGPTSATSQQSELIVSILSLPGATTGIAAPGGMSLRDPGSAAAAGAVYSADMRINATGVQSGTWTWTSPSEAWAALIQTYKTTPQTATNTYAASLSSQPVYVTMTSSGTTTPLTLGPSATTLATNQYYWASSLLYVNLGGTDPSTVTIDAAVRQIINLNAASHAADGTVFRRVAFHHGADRGVHVANNTYFLFDRCAFRYDGYNGNSGSLSINDCGTTGYARVTRCVFSHLQNDGVWWTNIANLEVDHNTFDVIGALANDVQSDCMQIYLGGGATANGTWIHHNTSDMTGTSSPKGHITISGGSPLTGGIVEWNMMIAGDTGINMAAGAMIVRHNTGTGQTGSTLSMGPAPYTVDGLQVYRNLAYATHSGITFYGPSGNVVTNVLVANNTIVDVSFCGFDISCASITGTMANNIIWGQTVTPNLVIRYSPTSGGSTLAPDYNDYSTVTNGWKFGSTTYSTLAAWRAAASADTHSISSNPLFTNPSTRDYSLGASSPARNAGTIISPVTDGFLGAAPDIGYREATP